MLNRNQDLLGKSMLVLRRHASRLTELTEPEWGDLHPFIRIVFRRVEHVLSPTRLNYAFLGNVDDHVHLHIVPRYAEPVPYAGQRFEDVGFPGHYSVDEPNLVSDDLLARIARDLRIAYFEEFATHPGTIIPPRRVRPTALCVLSRGEEVLVAGGEVPATGEAFLRPPGGEVHFGERAQDAVRREVREEVGIEVVDITLLGILEDVYIQGGETGHEIDFIFDARAEDPSFYEQESVLIQEEVGAPVSARWMNPGALRADPRQVVPQGLLDLVDRLPRLSEPPEHP